jgi:hypothetical protein
MRWTDLHSVVAFKDKDEQDQVHDMQNIWQGDEQGLMKMTDMVKERLLAIGWDARLTVGYFSMKKGDMDPMSEMKHYWVTVFEEGHPKLYVDIFNPYHHMFVIPLVHPLAKHYRPESFGPKESSQFDFTVQEKEFQNSKSKQDDAPGEPKVVKQQKPEGQGNKMPFR